MTVSTSPRRLPGDWAGATGSDAALRVDHAGEYGAQRIYAGQLAVLKNHAYAKEIIHMAAQEQVHLAAFNRLLPENRVRPTLLMPVWHIAGYLLGAGTALLGARAAMACTVAVESVITDHYNAQLASGTLDPAIAPTVTQFRDEEMEHHAIGLAHQAADAPFYGLLTGVIGAGCRAAIWLTTRL
jgi:ubiquinone biosynthesis monooxygenase Coq7